MKSVVLRSPISSVSTLEQLMTSNCTVHMLANELLLLQTQEREREPPSIYYFWNRTVGAHAEQLHHSKPLSLASLSLGTGTGSEVSSQKGMAMSSIDSYSHKNIYFNSGHSSDQCSGCSSTLMPMQCGWWSLLLRCCWGLFGKVGRLPASLWN